MALKHGLLRAHPQRAKREDGAKTAHLQMHPLDDMGQPWRVAVTDRQLLQELWDQARGPGGNGWNQLGGKTPFDAPAVLLERGNN